MLSSQTGLSYVTRAGCEWSKRGHAALPRIFGGSVPAFQPSGAARNPLSRGRKGKAGAWRLADGLLIQVYCDTRLPAGNAWACANPPCKGRSEVPTLVRCPGSVWHPGSFAALTSAP